MASVFVLAACGNEDADTAATEPTEVEENGGAVEPGNIFAEAGLDDNLRFTEPRTISVGLWNRVEEVEADETYWANRIAAEILEAHNIIIDWRPTPRWGENEFQATLLSAQEAPDVGWTFDAAMVTTMAGMGGIVNLYPYLTRYREILPNMFAQVTETNIFWNLDADTNELFTITGRRASEGVQNTVTFIREDWLNALDLPIPTTTEEFEATLLAFRDRADELPGMGEDVSVRVVTQAANEEEGIEEEYHYNIVNMSPDDIVPYLLTNDVGWDARGLFHSFIPNDVTEREWFVYGFDDRLFQFEDAMREGTRVLNRWFSEGLLWNNFVLGEPSEGHDLIRLGLVGSFHATWDQAFRPGDGFTTVMRENVGQDASFIAINPFDNDAGANRLFASGPTDRFAFLPSTNDEVVASLLFLDFMNRPETLDLLQFGLEDVHHEVRADGVLQMLDPAGFPVDQQFSGSRNFDINPLINGVWFDLVDEERALATAAAGYPGISEEAIMNAFNLAVNYAYVFRNVNTRAIASEEGMSIPLIDLRDQIFHRLIVQATADNFDTEFDREYAAYMLMGGSAIIAEREQAWIETFGDVDAMPAIGE